MFLLEDREIINIYNRQIIQESSVGASEIHNPEMKELFDQLYKAGDKAKIYNKINTHIQAKNSGSSGSMFLGVEDAEDLLDRHLFISDNTAITWDKYGSVGGKDVGYYAIVPNITGLIGNLSKSKLPQGSSFKLMDTKEDPNHYGLQATVNVNADKLPKTNFITIIFKYIENTGSYIFSSMYPGPQSGNLHLDKNTGVTNSSISSGNKISKTLHKNNFLSVNKFVVPFYRTKTN